MSKIYKYFSADVIKKVFPDDDFCNLKCSFPKDYNDPYELFLGLKRDLKPEYLAFYNEIVHELPQFPTTCFSKSPISSPMWAHYANNHSGFAIEFELEKLQQYFEGCPIWDVSYRKEPHPNLSDILVKAAGTLKPRHVQDLRKYTFVEAYFSKYEEWSYENEIRFVDTVNMTKKIEGNDILRVPLECVTKILVGPRAKEDFIVSSLRVAERIKIDWLKQIVGKSNPRPYFIDFEKRSFHFNNNQLRLTEHLCQSCSEPLLIEDKLCPWCKVTDWHEEDAARNNPFRLLESAGLLEEYLKGYNEIKKN